MIPEVSVLLPFRDSAWSLLAAAESILADGFQNLELLLLGDGSGDEGPQIARALAARDPRVRYLPGPPLGLVPTLNRGLSAARAPLVARMDADDISLPGRLMAQRALLGARPEVAAVDGQVETFTDEGPVAGGMARFVAWLNTLETPQSLWRGLFVESPLCHPAVMARRDVLLAVGGYIDEGPEDYHLWLRVVLAGHRLYKLPQRVLRWRDHPRRLTRTDARYQREAFFALKWRALHALGILTLGDPVVVWGAGRGARPWIRALVEAGHRVTGIVDIDPRKQGTTRHGIPTYPIAALPTLPWRTCLVAVGSQGARPLIAGRLRGMGIPLAPAPGGFGAYFVT